MSIEVLPNELLVQIFRYFPWSELSKTLSLVNRRWYQLIGSTPLIGKARLHLSICAQPMLEEICIPLAVLRGSDRNYRTFSFEMSTMDSLVMRDEMGPIIGYCRQRWTMDHLRIVAGFEQWIKFLQDYNELLNDAETVNIAIKSLFSEGLLEADGSPEAHFELKMEKVRLLHYEHLGPLRLPRSYEVTLNTPNLEVLRIKRSCGPNNIHFEFSRCAKLRSIITAGPGTTELESISSARHPVLNHLQLTDASISTSNFGATFRHLNHICLKKLQIVSPDHPVECLNLTKLVLIYVILDKPLKLRTPRLQTLICTAAALQWLQLEDALQADRISIYMASVRTNLMFHPASLSFFRKMNLTFNRSYRCDNAWFAIHSSYLGTVSELHVHYEYPKDHHRHLQDVLVRFTQVSVLSFKWMSIPADFGYLPPSVEKVHIKDCQATTTSIRFPPSVSCVEVRNLWKWNTPGNHTGMQLLPEGRFAPLRSEIVHIRKGKIMTPKMVYSTVNAGNCMQ